MAKTTIGWGVEDDPLNKHNIPIEKHKCNTTCTAIPEVHEKEEIWDDFELSKRQREVMNMEVIRARGRDVKERTLIRRFKSTFADDPAPYVLRLETATNLTKERMGDICFETQEELDEYYNYALKAFRFTEVSPILPESNGWDFDENGDTVGWGFDEDGEETSGWDIED